MDAASPLDRAVGLSCAARVSHEVNWGNGVTRAGEDGAEGVQDIVDSCVK